MMGGLLWVPRLWGLYKSTLGLEAYPPRRPAHQWFEADLLDVGPTLQVPGMSHVGVRRFPSNGADPTG